MKAKYLLLFIISVISLNALNLPNVHSQKWTDKYDEYFRKYSKRFFGVAFNWKWFKAQAIAESELVVKAKSKVGARGLMQIMPATFAEIKKKFPELKNIHEPRWNIAAGIYYDAYLYRLWTAKRPHDEKLKYTFASYNAGFNRILKAQRLSKTKGYDITYWEAVEKIAHEVENWNHHETIRYIDKIQKLMKNNTNY